MPRLLLACWVAACAPVPLTPWTPPSSPRITADHTHLRDEAGRVVVLRGVNVRALGLFDVTLDETRCPPPSDVLEAIPELTDAELDRMRDLGFSVIRLPVNWSGIEPTMGTYDEAYLAALEDLVARAAARDLYTLIDFHQDGWSKDLGEDGAPTWATYGASGPIDPALLLCGPLGATLGDRRLSPPVSAAFHAFFGTDAPSREMLQAAYRAMVLEVAQRFADEPHVVGYDLFNEPVFDDRTLRHFHEELATELRAADPNHLVFFEPSGIRNVTERGLVPATPFAVEGAVYAPHLYTLAFSDPRGELDTVTPERLAPNFERMLAETAAWHVPLFVGEWGIRPDSPGTANYIAYTYDLLDAASASSTVWVWKEASQGSWGLHACDDGDATFATCVERSEQFAAHARIHAERIAGEPLEAHYDASARTFRMRFSGRTDDAPHVIRLPADYPNALEVTCDGAPVVAALRDLSGRLEALCAGTGIHELRIEPTP